MSVDRREVERIAQLARLRLEEGEVERLTEELNRILEHAMTLRDLDPRLDEAGVDTGEPVEIVAGVSPPSAALSGGGSAEVASVARSGTSDGDDARRPEPALSGVRGPEVERADPLQRPPGRLAPRWEQGFFVVPPPPGVSADESGEPGA